MINITLRTGLQHANWKMGRPTTKTLMIKASPPKVIWEQHVALGQLCGKVSIGYNGTPQIYPQNCPFPFDDHHPHLIHPSLDRPLSPPQTASGSNQTFCHSTLFRQTDRPTDRHTDRRDKRQVYSNRPNAYAVLYK